MPQLAANLTMLWGDLPFLDRFAAARAAGFRAVEYLFPYPFEAKTLRRHLDDSQLLQVLHNLPAGDWANGERGIACLNGREEEFKQGVDQAIEYAAALNCSQVNCLAGILPASQSASAAREILIRNLSFAAARLKSAGIRLLIEPINTHDVPGFFLNTTRQATEIINAVGSDNLSLQFDIYHMQIMEGDVAATIRRELSRIAHMQLADVPGRHEPGTGGIPYDELLNEIDRAGYRGWIGCEYIPKAGTVEGLQWANRYLKR